MSADYKETVVEPGDTRSDVLEMLAGGGVWVLITAYDVPGDENGFGLKVDTGSRIVDVDTVRNLLTKTLEALP